MTHRRSHVSFISERWLSWNKGTKPPRDEILQQTLALDLSDRAYLADELERSLPSTAFESDEIATAWPEEIDRRIAAYDRRETTAISFDSALDHIRTALAERRSRMADL